METFDISTAILSMGVCSVISITDQSCTTQYDEVDVAETNSLPTLLSKNPRSFVSHLL